MSTYKYAEPSETTFGPIPAGEYDYTVIEAGQPKVNDRGTLVLPIKLDVGKDHTHVYDNPSQGTDKNGEPFDGIAKFLKSCNRAPAIGQEPNWSKLVGAKGRARIKVETATLGKYAGRDVNKVHHYIYATDVKTQKPPAAVAGKGPVDTDEEPDTIPF